MSAKENKALVARMIEGLNKHEIEEMEDYWADDMTWYGPAGIGTKRGLKDFQDNHQRPHSLIPCNTLHILSGTLLP